ncbi:ABC transporter ATP-binding protein [Pseudonocardia sp. H11422]|uniref:ABC transporter ATP-binding protein n=1 Tax=Pseudonocardia sp. H11422 TaxID=2835866 RepID=UPI0020291A0B|nr:ABC transporter ATP-binding protein [Pseudonocardia sp. H11422]
MAATLTTTGTVPATTTTQPKIGVMGVSKRFTVSDREVTALDAVDLAIEPGQFFVIVGPSGCGKTTLLRILAGLEDPTEGEVHLSGASDDRPDNSMIFQGDSIFPWMTVRDNASYGLTLRNRPASEIRDVVDHYLDKTGLTQFADAYPHQLSGGMRQRVSIARAFANDPDVLLMDEPFSALDEQNKTLLQDELLRIWEETRKTVVFITHSVDEAVSLGDRIMVMTARPGRVKAFVDVPFERPRSVLELRQRPEYGEIVFDIWQQLRDEVTASQQASKDAAVAARRRRWRR